MTQGCILGNGETEPWRIKGTPLTDPGGREVGETTVRNVTTGGMEGRGEDGKDRMAGIDARRVVQVREGTLKGGLSSR